MSEKSFTSELHRARSRADAKTLLCDIEDSRRYSRDVAGLEKYEGTPGGNHLNLDEARWENPDKALAYLALAMAQYDDPDFLGLLSAGLLEDILRDPSPELLERIVTEARKTARFRWMLSGVWLHAIADRARAPVAKVVGGVQLEDPLPPSPF